MVAALDNTAMGEDLGKHRKTPALSHWSKNIWVTLDRLRSWRFD